MYIAIQTKTINSIFYCVIHKLFFLFFSTDKWKFKTENRNCKCVAFYRKTAEEDKNKKRGYCECCCVHYEDLDKVMIQTSLALLQSV